MSSIMNMNVRDLIHGEGEWKNMQEVVRKAFRHNLEVQNEQTDKISKLSLQVSQLQEELNRRPSYEDIERLIDLKLLADRKRSAPTVELEGLRLNVAHINKELEKRVTLQHFTSVVGKKVDKSDALIKELSKSSVQENVDEIAKVKLDFMDLKYRLDHLTEVVEEQGKRESDYPRTAEQVIVLRSQIENLYRHVNDTFSKEQVQQLVAEKVSRVDVDTMLAHKADTSVVFAFTAKLEQALEQHEKLITALRLSASDPSLFHNDVFLTGSSRSSNKSRSSKLPNLQSSDEVKDFEVAMRDGRIESVISGLWSRMNNVLKDFDSIKKMLKSVDEEMKSFRVVMRGTAALEKVEVLAVVVEEQRLRIDSILQGSTKISPIAKELRRFDERLKEINEFLKLPQPKKLKEMFDEITSFAEELSKGLMDVGNAVNSTIAPELHVISSRVDTLDARWEAGLHDKDRVEYIMDYINLAGTKFENVRDVAHSLREVWALLDSKRLSDSAFTTKPCLLNRLEELEHFQSESLKNIETHRQKIQALKEVLVSMGASVDKIEKFPSARNEFAQSRRGNDRLASSTATACLDEIGIAMGQDADMVSPASLPPPSGQDPLFDINCKPPTPSNSSVDFEAVLGQLFNSLEDMKVPIRSSSAGKGAKQEATPNRNYDLFMMSITDVDTRLAELNKEKQRIRQNALNNI